MDRNIVNYKSKNIINTFIKILMVAMFHYDTIVIYLYPFYFVTPYNITVKSNNQAEADFPTSII